MIKQLVRSPQAWLAAFVLLDVLHRFIQLCAGPFPLSGDAPLYWRLGGALASGEGMLSVDPEVIRTPIYPAFLAIFRALFGAHGLQAAIVGQNVLAMLASLAVALAGARITGKAWAAPLTYLVLLGCTGRVQYDQMILTESLSGTLLALHGVGFVLGVLEGRRRWWWLAGVTGALLVLTRPSLAMLPVGEGVLLATFLRPGVRPWLGAALIVGLPALSMATWMARNHVATGEALLVGNSATHAWEHTFQLRGAALPLPAHVEQVLPAGLEARNGWTVKAELDGRGWGFAKSSAWMADAVAEAKQAHPGTYWKYVATATVGLWVCNEEAMPFYVRDRGPMSTSAPGQVTWHEPQVAAAVQTTLALAYKFPSWLVSAFSLCALASAIALVARGSNERVLGLWVLTGMGYFSAVTALKMYPLYRFQVPLHPALALAIGCCVASLCSRWPRRVPKLAADVRAP